MSRTFLPFHHRLPSLALVCAIGALYLGGSAARLWGQQQGGRTTLATVPPDALAAAVDAGPIPSSQRMTVTLWFATPPERASKLDAFLADVTNPGSAAYHHWLSTEQYAARFGASAEQLAGAAAWAGAQNLQVEAVSPSATRIAVSGFAPQFEAVFDVKLHTLQIAGQLHFANVSQPSLLPEAAALFSAVEGLDNLPNGASGVSVSLSSLAALVDANQLPVVTIEAIRLPSRLAASQVASLGGIYRQAAAQGITMLVDGASEAGAFAEVTAIADPGSAPAMPSSMAGRPRWQAAPGLPNDDFRQVPDFAEASIPALVQALGKISAQTGGRLGNLNPVLYALAPIPGLFTQGDSPTAGTWEPATGLGRIDPAALVKLYPRGSGTSVVSLSSSATAPIHGQTFTLTATASTTNGGGVPTGTVTFTAAQPAFPTSSATLNANGVALSPAFLLPGGTYNISATYSGDANYASTVSTITITVQPEAALFSISAPASVALGGTLTATVTLASASGFGTPSASVTVTPSGITGAPTATQNVTGSNGTASAQFSFSPRQAGSVSLQASCTSTDPSFTCFTPQTSTTNIPQAAPTVHLSITPAAPTAGATVYFTATIAGVAGVGPTGSVQFFDGPSSIGFGSAPTATYNGTLAPGTTHQLSAIYQGDSNYLKATSNVVPTSVGTAPTTTVVNASASTAAFGQPITLNITVASTVTVNGTMPTGTLTFTGAGSTTSALVSGGSANVTLNNLPVGSYTVTTAYSGDVNYGGSTGNTVAFTVTQSNASLNASISSTSFTTGSSATLTVTITLPGNALLPPGSGFLATIAGLAGASYPGTFNVNTGGNTGTGSVTIPAPVAGTYTIQVTCAANVNFTCTPSALSIASTATSGTGPTNGLAATIAPASALPGSAATVTAIVTAPLGTVPTGSVTATITSNAGVPTTSSAVLPGTPGTNTATVTIPVTVPMAQGGYIVAVACSGTNFPCTAVNLTLISTNTPGKVPTQTVLTAAPGTGGSSATVLTAAVSSLIATNGAVPSGTATFFDGTTQIAVALITSGTSAATTMVNLAAGTTHVLTAVYSGDLTYATSTSAAIDGSSSTAAPSTTTLSANVTGGLAGTNILFTAVVAGASANASGPTGTVSFYLGGVSPILIGTATLAPVGPGLASAVFSTSTLPSGGVAVFAVYKGDNNFSTSTSNSISLGLSDYAVAFVPQNVTLTQGSYAVVTTVVTPVSGFAGTVTLACTPPPSAEMTCSFSPTSLIGGGNSTLVINTAAPTRSHAVGGEPRAGLMRGGPALGEIALAALSCFFLPRRRRRLPAGLLCLLIISLTWNLGCSANDFSPTAPPTSITNAGTPLGTTLLSITTSGATTAGTVRHNYTFQVTVQ